MIAEKDGFEEGKSISDDKWKFEVTRCTELVAKLKSENEALQEVAKDPIATIHREQFKSAFTKFVLNAYTRSDKYKAIMHINGETQEIFEMNF